ncbi:MAG: Gfo/Idh/MocA family oxidoreductase [Actinobacteria bacterium]|nr:Gfo/Idh/MocA family oxidoreductase [Actinomycetota bacterium]
MSTLEIALVGAGVMGRHHARIIVGSTRARLAMLIDPAPAAEALAREFGVPWFPRPEAAASAHAAIIASPTDSHEQIGLELLDAGLPLLVEKPLAETLSSATRLVERSRQVDVALMCGFVERYNPAVNAARSRLTEPPRHLVTVRHSPPAERISTDVVFDLLIHDLDIAVMLHDHEVTRVVSSCWAPASGAVNEIADASLTFGDVGVATVSASRASQRKSRRMLVSTSEEHIDVDLVRNTVTVYRHIRHELSDQQTYRAQTVIDIPFVRHSGEPLQLQFEHFLDLAEGRADADAERASLLPAHVLADQILTDQPGGQAP